MKGDRREGLHRRFAAMETQDLLRISIWQADDYATDALEVIAEVLEDRGLDREELDGLRERADQEEAMAAEREEERVRASLERIHELDADSSSCHLCRAPDPEVQVPFGLEAFVEPDEPGGVSGLSLVASALTLPLLGVGMVFGNARAESILLTLSLRLCGACSKRKRWLGTWNLAEREFNLHPAWPLAIELGFEAFVPPNVMAGRQRSGASERDA
jgi:hypothetical protein